MDLCVRTVDGCDDATPEEVDRYLADRGLVAVPVALAEALRYAAGTLRGLAEQDCAYDDNCPPFAGTRHGTCTGCRARAGLAKLDALSALPGGDAREVERG